MNEQETPADKPKEARGDRAGSATATEAPTETAADAYGSSLDEGASTTEPEPGGRHGSTPEEGAAAGEGGPDGAATPPPQPAAGAPNWDRIVILAQLVAGVALVVFGALLAALTKEATHDIGTAVIGVGAALIPSGAAASATARIAKTNSGG